MASTVATIEPPADVVGPVGPRLWAVALALAGLFYLWTRVLGRSIPGGGGGRGHRVGAAEGRVVRDAGGRRAEMMAARERQQRHLSSTATRRADDGEGDDDEDAGERKNASSAVDDGASAQSIQERMRSLKERQEERERQRRLEEKKKKQRMLFLKQKALEEEEEEMRRKDAELGPGWRYREDPNAATANSVNNMDPQSGNCTGGGYKPQARKRRGG